MERATEIMRHSCTRKKEKMTRDTEFDNDLIHEKRRIARKRRRNRLIAFYLLALLLIISISFNAMLYYEKIRQKAQIDELTVERDELIADMNSNYITNEAANQLVAEAINSAEQGKSDEGRQK